MNKLTWEWMSDNCCCFATVTDAHYRRQWEMSIEPIAADLYQKHYARRGPFRIEVLTTDLDDNVLATRRGSRKYPTIAKARAAAVRLMRRVKQDEHEARGLHFLVTHA